MTIKELKEAIDKLPDDMKVWISAAESMQPAVYTSIISGDFHVEGRDA